MDLVEGFLGPFHLFCGEKIAPCFPSMLLDMHADVHVYTHISFFLSIRLTIRPASDGQRAKGNEHSAGIRPGEPSPTGTFHSERQAPFKFRFFCFSTPPRQPHLCHFIPSSLLACLPVCLFASRLFFFCWSSAAAVGFHSTISRYFCCPLCCFCIFPSFHLSISLPLSLFICIYVKERPRIRTRSKTRTSSSHGVLGKLSLL